MSNHRVATVLLIDRYDDSRTVVADTDTADQVVEQWIEQDTDGDQTLHGSNARPLSTGARRLVNALRAGSWDAVYAAADALAVSVTVLESDR